jgi:CRISPR/Cas system-associated exonuclease Cas4 (RecB family)
LIHISASSIKDYLQCPKRVHFRRTAAETSISTDEQGAGSAVHNIVETKWQTRDKEYEKLICVQYNVNAEMMSRFTRGVSNYYSQYAQLMKESDKREFKFNIPLYKNVELVGKMDVLSSTTDTVIDWKTSEAVPKDISYDPQFIIYYLAYKELYNREPTVLLINLSRNKVVQFEPKKHYINTIKNEIIPSMVQAMLRNDYPRIGLFNGACENCSFIDTCWKEII